MRGIAMTLALLLAAGAEAQVYTWEDEHGNTHYGDRPPAEHEAETLDLDTGSLSTMGGAGLRPAEEAALERLREEQAAAAERRLQNRALALERERIRAEQATAEAALEAARKPRVIYRDVDVGYPPVPWYEGKHRHSFGFSFDYHYGEKYGLHGKYRPRPEYPGYPGHRPRRGFRPGHNPGPTTLPVPPRRLTGSGGRLGVTAGGPPNN